MILSCNYCIITEVMKENQSHSKFQAAYVLVSLSVLVYVCKGSFSGERECVQAHITKQFKAHYNLKRP